eukprot:scaffold138828_cov22-Tisochrysis_lutea.AAC.1
MEWTRSISQVALAQRLGSAFTPLAERVGAGAIVKSRSCYEGSSGLIPLFKGFGCTWADICSCSLTLVEARGEQGGNKYLLDKVKEKHYPGHAKPWDQPVHHCVIQPFWGTLCCLSNLDGSLSATMKWHASKACVELACLQNGPFGQMPWGLSTQGAQHGQRVGQGVQQGWTAWAHSAGMGVHSMGAQCGRGHAQHGRTAWACPCTAMERSIEILCSMHPLRVGYGSASVLI